MDIDWITVGAQIVNFLVLVWLLQRFLYGPVTRAMDRREQRIKSRLEEAEVKRDEAEREAERLREKQEEVDEQRRRIFEEARREADELRERLERQAREEVDHQRRSWREQVIEERDEFLRDLRTRTARHVYELARTALADLSGAQVDGQTAARFARRLRELDEDEAAKIADAAREAGNTIRIESSFELAGEGRDEIEQAVAEIIAEGLELEIQKSDDLLFGIRLVAGSQTVEWSLSRYLERLESAVMDKLSQAHPRKEREAA